MRRRWMFVVPALLLWALAAPSAAQDDKAEQERRKREEKALKKELKEERQAQEILDEIQGRIDEDVLQRLQSRHPDDFLQDYVNELGQSLVPKETPPGVLFSFRVLQQPEPEAMAYPDGRILLSTGLLCFVENEAQLSVVLGHEIGHVLEKHTIELIKESRSVKRRFLPGVIGALGGALVGGAVKGKEGAAVGAAVGATAGVVFSFIDFNRYSRRQEDEADLIGTRLSLQNGFDANEGATFFEHLAERFGDNDALSNYVYASHSRNVDRMENIQKLLGGELAGLYTERRAGGELTLGSGQLPLFTSAMVRDAAIDYMEIDRYDIAKGLLESIKDYRMRDPKTLGALGRLYKMVGRTAQDKAMALDYLQRAVELDERNLYPELYRDLGLMQARLAAGGDAAPAVESLKKYIRGYMDRRSDPSPYPPDILRIYDYLLVFGDSTWTAPRMEGAIIRAAAPAVPPATARKTPGASGPARSVIPPPKKNQKP